MSRRKRHAEHVNHERWLVSYADFITLLFAFFTTLYSISSVDQKKAGKLMYSMLTALNVEFFPSASGVSGYPPMSNPAVVPLDNTGTAARKADDVRSGGNKVRLAGLADRLQKLATREAPTGSARDLANIQHFGFPFRNMT